MRERANNRNGRDGRGSGRRCNENERNVSAVTVDEHASDEETAIMDNTWNSDRGGRNRRGFGHGAYGGGRT